MTSRELTFALPFQAGAREANDARGLYEILSMIAWAWAAIVQRNRGLRDQSGSHVRPQAIMLIFALAADAATVSTRQRFGGRERLAKLLFAEEPQKIR